MEDGSSAPTRYPFIPMGEEKQLRCLAEGHKHHDGIRTITPVTKLEFEASNHSVMTPDFYVCKKNTNHERQLVLRISLIIAK